MRRTKIIATLGPASDEPSVLQAMMEAGMDVARINASHASPADFHLLTERVHRIARLIDRPVAVLLDLCGPKVRLGDISEQVVQQGDRIQITGSSNEGTVFSCNHAQLASDVAVGDRVLIDDGKLSFEVAEITGDVVTLTTIVGGTLKAHKGINLPDSVVSIPSLTDKDLADLAAGVDAGVDVIAVSFVQRADDIRQVRAELAKLHASDLPVIAKIEKPKAVEHLHEILQVADGVMVARGDLGVEAGPHRIAVLQKQILQASHRIGAIDIVATQMLDSMERSPVPTRAEASDVGNAIMDGVDAVMLSGETASGKYPVEAVQMMATIALEVERSGFSMAPHFAQEDAIGCDPVIAEVSRAAAIIARNDRYKAIIALTASGRTARIVTAFYPRPPIFAITHSPEAFNRMALLRGVHPLLMKFAGHSDAIIHAAEQELVQRGLLAAGDEVVVVAGTMENPNAAHMVKVLTVEEREPVSLA